MNHYPNSIKTVIKNFSKLPGIGEKTAERLVIHILKRSSYEANKLAQSIITLKRKLILCSRCFSFSDDLLCSICSNKSRNSKLVCVVEQPADMVSIEKSRAFNGLYHVLGGVISPMNGIGPDKIRIKELIQRITKENTTEVLIATGTNLEGEATASYLSRILASKVYITRIASGVPMGGNLKYIDMVTLKRAIEGRYAVN